MAIQCYKDLTVWKDGIQLTLAIYKITAAFPADERYGLVSQLRRCAVSIPSNIAEGHTRHSTREYLRHISIAQGSLAELETQLHIAAELGYGRDRIAGILSGADRLGRQLCSLTKSLRLKLDGV